MVCCIELWEHQTELSPNAASHHFKNGESIQYDVQLGAMHTDRNYPIILKHEELVKQYTFRDKQQQQAIHLDYEVGY